MSALKAPSLPVLLLFLKQHGGIWRQWVPADAAGRVQQTLAA